MIRIICSKCKNAYLKKEDDNLICPSCEAVFPESTENLLLGAQYYNEGDFSQANDCLMKYIVKNGADPEAMFYKALCDGFAFDEDTVSLNDVYTKILESLSEVSDDLFIRYLALANDEAEKLEKLIAESHIKQFETADSEKIKKEVATIINFRNEAKEFRAKLTELTDAYNERATEKISVKFSTCYLVQPETASEVGALKFEKVKESIEAHTVFTGILSTDIKNLEIYYRCIVMFFEKDRQKYDFLMESAEKFNELAKLLEEGRYASIKGVPTIANKLKSAAYDFFQESLKDHDDEFEQQTETVVLIVPETVEIPVEEETEFSEEQNDSTAESSEETTEYEDVYSSSEAEEKEEAEEDSEEENTEEQPVDEVFEEEETEISETEETTKNIPDEAEIIEIEAETEEEEVVSEETETEEVDETVEETVEIPEEEPVEESVIEIPEESAKESESKADTLETIAESGEVEEPTEETAEKTGYEKVEATEESTAVVKHKKSYGPFVAIILVIFAVIGLIAAKVVPAKLNAANYEKASTLATEKKYAEAAEVFAELGDYEDAEEKTLECRYNNACALEAEKKYSEAKVIFAGLGDYEDSSAKKNSCIYNEALLILDAGKFDEAAETFESLEGYADSANMIKECSYKKAVSLINNKDYDGAIAILTTLGDYSDSATKILEAKYGYVTSNLDAENETTLSYLKDLARAKFKDSADLRNKLLGTSNELSVGVTSCVNYSTTDTKTALNEVDKSKVIYFHIVVTEPELYNKKLTIDYRTSMGYHDTKGIVLTEGENTYAFAYPSTENSGYTVVFKLLSDDNTTLTTQEILVK